MKVIIAGSRGFNDYAKLLEVCDFMLNNSNDIEIISGTCEGADLLGERYANDRGYDIKRFPADWNDITSTPLRVKYNKQGKPYNALAGLNRNEQMANYSDALIAFWNGKSHGTKNMIELAQKKGLKVKVVNYT